MTLSEQPITCARIAYVRRWNVIVNKGSKARRCPYPYARLQPAQKSTVPASDLCTQEVEQKSTELQPVRVDYENPTIASLTWYLRFASRGNFPALT